MHRSAQALVETCGAGENFSDGSIDEEADALLLGAALEVLVGHVVGRAVPELVHHLLELLIGENLD